MDSLQFENLLERKFCVHVIWNIFVVKVKLFRRDVNRILIGDKKKQLYIYKAPLVC